MFELHIADTDVTSGSVPVTWCLDKELLEALKDEGAVNPHVVICVAPVNENYNSSMEYRKVVPLKDMMTYISFNFPGKNRIYGLVSWRDKKEAKNHYLERYGREYFRDIINYTGDDYNSHISAYLGNRLSKPIEVEVPEECFAEEPSKFEKEWLNYLGVSKFTDECSLRKRRLLYIPQAILFVLDIVIRLLVTFIATMSGSRNLTARYLFHPLTYSLEDTILETLKFSNGSYFVGRGKNKYLNYARLLFMPWVLCSIVLSFWIPFFKFIMLGFIVALLMFAIFYGIHTMFLSFKRDRDNLSEVVVSNDTAWYLDPEEMKILMCSGQKKPLKQSDLPPKYRTWKLKLQELKSQVCKPFAG